MITDHLNPETGEHIITHTNCGGLMFNAVEQVSKRNMVVCSVCGYSISYDKHNNINYTPAKIRVRNRKRLN